MDRTDERGAEAAARYFFELYANVAVTGETAERDAMSWKMCEFCSSIRADALADMADRVTHAGGKATLYDVSVGCDDLLDGYPVDLSCSQAPATGTATTTTAASPLTVCAARSHLVAEPLHRPP